MSDSKYRDVYSGRSAAVGNDDEFNYDMESGARNAGDAARSTVFRNQPYDEAVELSDDFDESVDTHAMSSSIGSPATRAATVAAANASVQQARGGTPSPAPGSTGGASATSASAAGGGGGGVAPAAARARSGASARADSPPAISDSFDGRGEYASDSEMTGHMAAGSVPASPEQVGGESSDMGGGGGGGGGGGEGGEGVENPGLTGVPPAKSAYNAADFAALKVPDDIRGLFEHISAFRPRGVELDTRLKCFMPEYIPSVGPIDVFLKPARPDGEVDRVGMAFLDEPAPIQSDPTVLDLKLRAASKKASVEPMLVRSIENADKSPAEIMKWIATVAEVQKSKAPPQVHYPKPMPDIEKLMREWPPGFEELLKEARLPGAELDLSVEEYTRVICALLDIPVYGSLVHSLHVAFTLYNEFVANPHFANMAAGGGGGGAATERKA